MTQPQCVLVVHYHPQAGSDPARPSLKFFKVLPTEAQWHHVTQILQDWHLPGPPLSRARTRDRDSGGRLAHAVGPLVTLSSNPGPPAASG